MFIVVLLLHEAATAKKIRTIGVSYIAIHGYIHPSHPNPETVFLNISMGSLAPEMTRLHLQWLNCEAAVSRKKPGEIHSRRSFTCNRLGYLSCKKTF